MLILSIVFLPLIAAAVVGFACRTISDRNAQLLTCAAMSISTLLSWVFLFMVLNGHEADTQKLMSWIDSGTFEFDWSIRVDTLTAVMMATVTTVSFLVHVYSIGYMAKDRSIPRFMSYLSLFTFFMLILVTSDNLVQLFFGWEGVGLASYLLIGFWYERESANRAAMKAFIVNRVGDMFFLLGIFAIFLAFDSVRFETIFAAAPAMADKTISFLGFEWPVMTICCLLLFLGAMGKSAQLGLHTWLPDAMEGPTPVSALIHAATMVTAGVFLVARMSPLFAMSETAMAVVTLVGAATAFFAATVGCTQNDIKRVIAYSTCSQLGYMFLALGVGAFGAGIFHLMTHAFFKALLFLGAGSVIHAMSDEQDMRRMGGIWKMIPVTYALMWIGSLALMGVPPLAGYFSKDMILEAAWASGSFSGTIGFVLGIVVVAMTAFYSTRLILMTFHGTPRADEKVMAHVHESPRVMLWPLFVLAFGAVFAGIIGYGTFVGAERLEFWNGSLVGAVNDVIDGAHHVPWLVKILPLLFTVGGFALAILFYGLTKGLPEGLAACFPRVYQFVFNKWYFDELYDRIFIRPAMALGRFFWKSGDGTFIDGLGPNGLASMSEGVARRLSRFQNGYVSRYALVMIVGLTVIVTWFLMTTVR